jgi:hypothetical protein
MGSFEDEDILISAGMKGLKTGMQSRSPLNGSVDIAS